jgi:hypothetical protein
VPHDFEPDSPEVLEETAGAYVGISIGDPASKVQEVLGPPATVPGSSGVPASPTEGRKDVHRGPLIAPGGGEQAIYPTTTFFLDDSKVVAFWTIDDDAETAKGVGPGDNLALARDRYPDLECGHYYDSEEVSDPDRFCAAPVGDKWLVFGNDPIEEIILCGPLRRSHRSVSVAEEGQPKVTRIVKARCSPP